MYVVFWYWWMIGIFACAAAGRGVAGVRTAFGGAGKAVATDGPVLAFALALAVGDGLAGSGVLLLLLLLLRLLLLSLREVRVSRAARARKRTVWSVFSGSTVILPDGVLSGLVRGVLSVAAAVAGASACEGCAVSGADVGRSRPRSCTRDLKGSSSTAGGVSSTGAAGEGDRLSARMWSGWFSRHFAALAALSSLRFSGRASAARVASSGMD